MNIISTKWIFRVKHRKDGSVDRFKARLVAMGFQQIASVGFFSHFLTLRIMFSIVVCRGWRVQYININNAFLNGKLQENVYIHQPDSFHGLLSHLFCASFTRHCMT